jgi:GNAT superfamily N-acetyltransferase
MAVEIRRATAADLPRVRAFYAEWRYAGEVQPADAVFVAADGPALLGVVRLAAEHGTAVLRGMRVAVVAQRQGIGTRLLDALVGVLDRRECYCIPYAHLVGFYGQAGFRVRGPGDAPAFLAERLARYQARGDGRAYLLMHRPAAPPRAVSPNEALHQAGRGAPPG